jgi:hypothetical protein
MTKISMATQLQAAAENGVDQVVKLQSKRASLYDHQTTQRSSAVVSTPGGQQVVFKSETLTEGAPDHHGESLISSSLSRTRCGYIVMIHQLTDPGPAP